MREALERHDGILRSVIEEHGGYVFSTGGGSFAAAFARGPGGRNSGGGSGAIRVGGVAGVDAVADSDGFAYR